MGDQKISQSLQNIFCLLFQEYGPQHWWPASELFEVMVGAILTQSATWRNVEKAISNLKAASALSPEALRQLNLSEIACIIRPSGYYSAKAFKLKSLADWLGEYYQDDLSLLFASDIAHLRQQLLTVHGIGEETADSIILYAANKPVFVVDAYTRRIVNRVGLAQESASYSAYQSLFMDNLPHDVQLFNEYHALLVCLAKNVCRSHPLCQQCCIADFCDLDASERVS